MVESKAEDNILYLPQKFQAELKHIFWRFYKIKNASHSSILIIFNDSNYAHLFMKKLYKDIYIMFPVTGTIDFDKGNY